MPRPLFAGDRPLTAGHTLTAGRSPAAGRAALTTDSPARPRPAALLPLLLLLLAPASAYAQAFTKITGVHPVLDSGGSRAVNWVDADGDGDLDLYVTSGGSVGEHNEYYRNDAGSFVKDTAIPIANDGIRADGSTWGDWDGDGDSDLFVVSWYGELNVLYENLGGGSFQQIVAGPAVTTGSFSEGCAWVDYDLDSDLDLYVANSGAGADADNLLYRNDGSGTLTAITTGPLATDGSTSRQPAWCDYDDDGDPDLFVACEGDENNRLYRNLLTETGTADFVELSEPPVTSDGGESYSASWGDFDNDGDQDLVVANQFGQNNFFYRNELTETGTATFSAITDHGPPLNAGWTVGTHWADMDNDGDLDLFMTNGYAFLPGTTRKNFLYRNDGGTLNRTQDTDVGQDRSWSFGAAWGDYDDDGDLDLYVANWLDDDAVNYLYRNEAQANGNHWLGVECEGTVSNRSGIGARIRVKATIDGSPVWQTREVAGSDGYCSQVLPQHFGLGDAATADSIVVRWPSGIVQTLTSVPADQRITITEPSPTGVPTGSAAPARTGLLRGAHPNPFRSATHVRFDLPAPADVKLEIFDGSGRRVRTLSSGGLAAGRHEIRWDGRDSGGLPAGTGVYFGRLTSGATRETTRILRIR